MKFVQHGIENVHIKQQWHSEDKERLCQVEDVVNVEVVAMVVMLAWQK